MSPPSRKYVSVAARGLPPMTDGPFYPPIAYRARALDWDADLTTVRGRAPDGLPAIKRVHTEPLGAGAGEAGSFVNNSGCSAR